MVFFRVMTGNNAFYHRIEQGEHCWYTENSFASRRGGQQQATAQAAPPA